MDEWTNTENFAQRRVVKNREHAERAISITVGPMVAVSIVVRYLCLIFGCCKFNVRKLYLPYRRYLFTTQYRVQTASLAGQRHIIGHTTRLTGLHDDDVL